MNYLSSLLRMQLGWRPLMDSYLASSSQDAVAESNRDTFSKIFDENKELIHTLFDWLVQPCLEFIRHECKLFITTSPLHLVHSLINLYTCLLDDIIAESAGAPIAQTQSVIWVQCLFIFSVIWTLGGTMTGDSRKKFDVFYRTLVSGTDQDHPKPKVIKLSKVCKMVRLMIFMSW